MPKILKEYAGDLVYPKDKLLEDIEDPKRELVFEDVILQRSDLPNANKRIYPHSILEKEVTNYQQLVRENRSFGELDHPDASVVSLKNVCWTVKDIYWRGNEVRGHLRILRSHPSGKIIEALIKDKVVIGISSRALGEVEKDSTGQYDVVQSGLVLVSFDAVAEPSTKNAFVNPQNMNESVEKYLMKNEHFSNDYIINIMLSRLICGKDRCDI